MREPPDPAQADPRILGSTPKDSIRFAVERQLREGSEKEAAPPTVSDHTLLRRIGRGAYGEVWLARNALGTLRAVKIVYRDHFQEDRPYEREFHGILKYEPVSRTHEGLVQVLHVGRNDEAGCFYYVMELADPIGASAGRTFEVSNSKSTGASESTAQDLTPESYTPRTLRSELKSGSRFPSNDAALLALRLATALAHLHAQGLVHRDIKPSNVIFVGGQPKLADIGLVTAASTSHSFVGTEGFVPPEGPGTPQADLYALGKLLYEIATGCDRMEFPQLPSDIAESPDGEALLELNEVMTRACAPAPQQRYAAATELQADLNLFLAGRSLRRTRTIERHLARLKRFAAAACVFLLLAVAAIWFAQREVRQARDREQSARERAHAEATLRQRAEAAEREQGRLREAAEEARANETQSRRQAEAKELAARKKAYAADMNLLRQALAADDLGRAQELLNKQRPRPGQEDLRGWEWRYHWQFCQSDAAFTLCQRSTAILSVSFSSDGHLLAVGTQRGEVTVWDVPARRMILQAPGSGRVAFAPQGDILAYADPRGTVPAVVLWDSRTQTERRRLPFNGGLREIVFLQDERLMTVDLGRSNNVVVWDVTQGTALSRLTAVLPTYAMGTIFLPTGDGTRFAHAVGGASQILRVVTNASGMFSQFRAAEELVTAIEFARDGRTLVTGGGYAEGTIKLWDLAGKQPIGSLEGHRSWVSCLKFLPDGKTLVSSSADRTIRLWDFEGRRVRRTLHGANGEIWTFDVSRDGRWLAGGAKDGSVVFWDLGATTNRPPAYRTRLSTRMGAYWSPWSYSADGRLHGTIDTEQRRRGVRLSDAITGEPVEGPSWTNVVDFAFSPDNRVLVATDLEGRFRLWDLHARREMTNSRSQSGPGLAKLERFLAGGRYVLTSDSKTGLRAWDAATWQETRRWSMSNVVYHAASSAAEMIAVAYGNAWIELLSMRDSEQRSGFKGPDNLVGIDLSPDGKTLAAASEAGTVELWDTGSRTRIALLGGVLLGYHSIAISPDGTRVAAGSNGQEAVKLWDLHSREEVATLPGRGSLFTDLRFSPDGNTISARNWNGIIHFWTAPSWEQIEAAEHAGETPPPPSLPTR